MPNRLANEKSPYLLQHANNPVNWYPWGEEAFAAARREDKPIFLSIGYSTCHWCHVMERESFENDEVADVLNQHFISIKVDREERPDLDRIYMLFVQAATGSGGWPMSVWLTPEARPFFGGTYFPPDNRYGRPGFKSLLEHLATAWRGEREKIERSGQQVIAQLRDLSSAGNEEAAGELQDVLDAAFNYFRRTFDPKLGGFGGAPKFPRPSVFNFLMRYGQMSGDEEAQPMVFKTLDEMAKGGMNDQLGGGFHRYSVDERWFVPHFEKMLYDQAQLAASYIEAYQVTKEEPFAQTARDIFDYVLRDLTHPDGGFYSAEDADSAVDAEHLHEKGEGAFYIWSAAEIREALGVAAAAIFNRRYGVEENGNVQEDPHGEFTGRNILYRAHPAGPDEEPILDEAIEKLMAIRAQRPRPHLDDKVLAGWNGMMISAFAKGAQALGEARYELAATKAAAFVREKLWRDGTLLRRYREGESAIEGFLDDYACMTNALVDLYETSFDVEHLMWAEQLADRAIKLFADPNGGFFSTAEGQADLVLRLKDDYDGAEPSGNSVFTLALLRLARIRGRADFREAAERTLASFQGKMKTGGPGLPQMLVAQMFAAGRPIEIVFSGAIPEGALRVLHGRFLPNAVVVRAEHSPEAAIYTQPGIYVCQNFSCQLPVFTADELATRLQ